MDLWDLTKLLVRRWYVAFPLLLVTVGAVMVAAQGTKPDYKALGHLQMIPPPGLGQTDETKPRPNNPWLNLGYSALGNAAVLKVTGDETSLKSLTDAGFSESVTITMNERVPLLEIEVIGSSPEQATGTVREVIRRLNEEIAAQQNRYDVDSIDVITTLTLSDGSTVEAVTSKVTRVLVVAAGVGILFTIAGTTAIDALLRRRTRRRKSLEAPELPAGHNGSVAVPRGRGTTYPTPTPSPVLMLPAGISASPVAPASGAARVHKVDDDPRPTVQYTHGLDTKNEPEIPPAEGPDSTIVLPLQMMLRDDRNNRR